MVTTVVDDTALTHGQIKTGANTAFCILSYLCS